MKRGISWLLCLSGTICLLSPSPVSAAPSAPVNLRIEDRVNPIAVDDTTPEYSWFALHDKANEVQSAYQILVASSPDKLEEGKTDKWDSGKVDSSNVAFISYAGQILHSREVCYWKVRTWDSTGEAGQWSIPARFEMGLLSNQDWAVNWIWHETGAKNLNYAYFRKLVRIPDKPIKRARAYLSSVHHHLFYINGKLIGKGVNFENPQRQYYQAFDIGPFLKPGADFALGLSPNYSPKRWQN